MTDDALHKGMKAEIDHVVTNGDTASAVGSGALPVLATPRLIGWLEAATCAAVDEALPAGSTSVGTRLGLEHLRPAIVGTRVSCLATLAHVDGRLLRFEVVATGEDGRVLAHGEITRVVVDEARFLARATG